MRNIKATNRPSRKRVVLALVLGAASAVPSAPVSLSAQSATPPAWVASPIAPLERTFLHARRLKDAADVTRAAGLATTPDGRPLADLDAQLRVVADSLAALRTGPMPPRLAPADQAAWRAMRDIAREEFPGPMAGASGASEATPAAPRCSYDAPQLAADSGLRALRARVMACYRAATTAVRVGDSTFNRLGVLGRLGWEPDRARREALWRALDTVWTAVNGANTASSPWRTLIRTEARAWGPGRRPLDRSARALGFSAAEVERFMLQLLEAWRAATPDSLIEPWDWWYQNGEASRRLAARIPRAQLLPLNAQYYRALGADVDAIGVHYDIAPRPGQTPVAYTTFGDRPRWDGSRWVGATPWVFASYADGGLDILNELMHETGHAVHIAAIRTRPAYADWPDANVFTEGIADLVALDAYEPAWQARWLGDSVPTPVAMRARYGGIMLDAAWALFEIRMHRDPTADPNATWGAITERYLHVRAHPERSWWAMRAQLFDLPGYLLNYAMGAIVVTDVRAALVARHGPWLQGDPGWYARVAPLLYASGREVPARRVVERLLGRRPGAAALVRDLARMRSTRQNPGG
jgi:hypothetical protein